MKSKMWRLHTTMPWSPEGYWASYSDLMAGILLVFAVASVGSIIYFTNEVMKQTQVLKDWRNAIQELMRVPDLQRKGVKVDPVNGRLIISEESLRYAINDTKLSDAGKQLLREIVPTYLKVIQQKQEFQKRLHRIEVSGHTDSLGTFQVNTDIGSARAANVLKFLIDEEESFGAFSDMLRTKACSAGYADTVPPAEGAIGITHQKNWPEARRIEIQIHFDELSILSELTHILDSLKANK